MTDAQIIGTLAGLLFATIVVAVWFAQKAAMYEAISRDSAAAADAWARKHNELIRAMHGGPSRVAESGWKSSAKLKLVRNSTET